MFARLLLLLSATTAFSQIPPVDEFDITQFISSRGSSPESIIRMDNNWAILWSCRQGSGVSQLDNAGISHTASQLELLEEWGLLEQTDSSLNARIPILDSSETRQLRQMSQEIASVLADSIILDIRSFVGELDSLYPASNVYCLLFSYVLDGLVWDELETQKLLSPRELSVEKPFWAGEVWALRPKRTFFVGTNSISDQGYSMKVAWTEPLIPRMFPFVSDWKDLSALLDDFVQYGQMRDESAMAAFAKFGFFDSGGAITVPVIQEKTGDLLYDDAVHLSQSVARKLATDVNWDQIVTTFHLRDQSQAIVILYHELMWDLLDVLETRGVIAKPSCLSDPQHVQPVDIGKLVFFVRPGS